MQSLKQEAIDAISKLPDTTTMDEIMYRLYVIDKFMLVKKMYGMAKLLQQMN